MADMTIDSVQLEVLFEATLHGSREDRLELLNKVRVANEKDPVSALVNVRNPDVGSRATAITELDDAISGIGE